MDRLSGKPAETDQLGQWCRQIETQCPDRWHFSGSVTATCINISENHSFTLQDQKGGKTHLRLHRPGYQTPEAIRSELAWLEGIERDAVIHAVKPIVGRNGDGVQTVHIDGAPRHAVLFEYLDGFPAPDRCDEMLFRSLGDIAARLHNHAQNWTQPPAFSRPSWDVDHVFGDAAPWGDWRDAPGVDMAISDVLARAQSVMIERLDAFGKDPQRFGLIHADMRAANVLIGGRRTQIIDFDDCGFSWFLYDFAAAVSFVEDHPDLDRFWAAWCEGYQRMRSISEADQAEWFTFVMLRRLALLAWIGSHIDAPEPQALAPDFAANSAILAERYLKSIV